MAAWHLVRRVDIGLRALGLLLCGIAYLAIRQLITLHAPPQSIGAIGLGLAAIGFITASAGSAMLLWGDHLLDEIEVSARWRARSNRSSSPSRDDIEAMDAGEASVLLVGRDADGSWTVRESAGMLLGRFGSAAAAQRFAEAERQGRCAITIAVSAGVPAWVKGRLRLGGEQATLVGAMDG